jgi:hypothetical protein
MCFQILVCLSYCCSHVLRYSRHLQREKVMNKRLYLESHRIWVAIYRHFLDHWKYEKIIALTLKIFTILQYTSIYILDKNLQYKIILLRIYVGLVEE